MVRFKDMEPVSIFNPEGSVLVSVFKNSYESGSHTGLRFQEGFGARAPQDWVRKESWEEEERCVCACERAFSHDSVAVRQVGVWD